MYGWNSIPRKILASINSYLYGPENAKKQGPKVETFVFVAKYQLGAKAKSEKFKFQQLLINLGGFRTTRRSLKTHLINYLLLTYYLWYYFRIHKVANLTIFESFIQCKQKINRLFFDILLFFGLELYFWLTAPRQNALLKLFEYLKHEKINFY